MSLRTACLKPPNGFLEEPDERAARWMMANRVSAQIPLKGGYRIPALAGAKTLCFFMLCAHGKDVWICMTLVAHNVELNIVFNVIFFFFCSSRKAGCVARNATWKTECRVIMEGTVRAANHCSHRLPKVYRYETLFSSTSQRASPICPAAPLPSE